MKILIVDRPLDRWDGAWDDALAADAAPRPDILPLTLGADSALVRPGFPCFLPDFAREGWELRLAPVIRVSRLGKWIEPRFAHRYIDALSLAAILRPAVPEAPLASPRHCGEAKAELPPASPRPPFLPIFDGAITPGLFTPLPEGLEAILAVKGAAPIPFTLSDLRAAETLALISRSVTLKSGDLIIPAMFPAAFPAAIGLDIAASILPPATCPPDGKPQLRARVK
ncbi:MAG: hypothetical protein NC391_06670 [Alistipes timonensis]|nr:hypothetical protein [Alistipes timonensis]